jgi:hypothetical protein
MSQRAQIQRRPSVPADASSALDQKEEFIRLAHRSDELLRELTAVRRRMDELAEHFNIEDLLRECAANGE